MKKIIALLLVVAIICITGGCSASFKHISNTVMNDEFQKSIEEIYNNDGGLESLFIPSFGTELSILKILSLHNLCNTKYSESMSFESERNSYRCSVEASLYSGKNEVMIDLLTNEAIEEEFYEAYRVASIIRDADLLEDINSRYENYSHSSDGMLSDRIYRALNESYLHKVPYKDDEGLANDVIEYINYYMNAEYLDTTFDALSNLTASVVFLLETNTHAEDELLEELHRFYTDEKNERAMIFEQEVIFEYYCRIIGMLRDHLSIQKSEDLFSRLAEEKTKLYSGLSYDVTTAKNFAMYIIALSYSDISISEKHQSLLKSLQRQITENIQQDDYLSISYMNLTSEYLGTDEINISLNDEEKSLSYLSATNQRRDFDELYVPNTDIVQLLMICDVSLESERRSELLREIDIFNYVDKEGFSQILNLYVCVMSNSHLITPDIRNRINEYINSAECAFGYTEYNGGYDFRSSVYYTNIKYILGGGADIGLR